MQVVRGTFSLSCGAATCVAAGVWVGDILNWSVAALAEDVIPRTRHDGTPWTTEDGDRLQRAGQALMRGVVAKVKGDSAKCVHTLGLQSWSHLFHPCFKCHTSREDVAEIANANLGSPPYAASSPADYDDACAIFEKWSGHTRPEDARTSHRHVEE